MQKLQCSEWNSMFIVERKVKNMSLMFSSPLLHPELFQLYNSWLTIFFTKCAHVVLVVLEKSTTFIILLHNEKCKKLNEVTWRGFVRGVNLLYQLILVKWFVLFWICGIVALTQYCKLISFFYILLRIHWAVRNNMKADFPAALLSQTVSCFASSSHCLF